MLTQISQVFDDNFQEYRRSLKSISYDKNNQVSLCSSEREFFAYDNIVEQYFGSVPSSPDVIHFKDDIITIIEFKNGKINRNKDRSKIKLKGIEGAFIALHKILTSEFRSDLLFEEVVELNKEYIIVYNERKNQRSGTDYLSQHLKSQGIKTGLDIYEGRFFLRVNTFSGSVFEERILPEL